VIVPVRPSYQPPPPAESGNLRQGTQPSPRWCSQCVPRMGISLRRTRAGVGFRAFLCRSFSPSLEDLRPTARVHLADMRFSSCSCDRTFLPSTDKDDFSAGLICFQDKDQTPGSRRLFLMAAKRLDDNRQMVNVSPTRCWRGLAGGHRLKRPSRYLLSAVVIDRHQFRASFPFRTESGGLRPAPFPACSARIIARFSFRFLPAF